MAGKELYQEGGEKLGSIRFEDGATVISMFKGSNASTPIHEGAHLWLEELARDATGPDATERLKQDYQTVLDWFGVKSYNENETVHHEQWASADVAQGLAGKPQ